MRGKSRVESEEERVIRRDTKGGETQPKRKSKGTLGPEVVPKIKVWTERVIHRLRDSVPGKLQVQT